MTAEIKAKRLFELLENLIEALNLETSLITTKPRSTDLAKLTSQKQQMLAEYELYLQEIAKTPHFFQTLSEDVKANLRTLSERFQTAALENEKRLGIALKSSEMIAGRIKEEARKAMGTTVKGYGQTGGYSRGTEKRTAPIAINQTL
ncbi:MAG: hypothetical protein R3261_12890 [Alphaproteobacteria bacterium]|nr:hypothetical protein [Alphaproteobacteria bacterium]